MSLEMAATPPFKTNCLYRITTKHLSSYQARYIGWLPGRMGDRLVSADEFRCTDGRQLIVIDWRGVTVEIINE